MKVLILSLFLLTSIILCELSERQIRIRGCMKLSKARIGQDSEYVQRVIDTLSVDSSKDEITNKLLSLSLLSCYDKIKVYEADDLGKVENLSRIPAMTEENKDLLQLEKWAILIRRGMEQKLNEELAPLAYAVEEIKAENYDFTADDFDPYKHRQRQQQQNEDEFYFNTEKKVDFDLFGINLTALDTSTKNILGLFLIVLVFSTVMYGLRYIKNLNKKEEKKKSKNKKKE